MKKNDKKESEFTKRIKKELKDKEQELKEKHKLQIEEFNSKKPIVFGGIQLNSTFSHSKQMEEEPININMNIEEKGKFKYNIGPKALHMDFDLKI